MTKRRAIVFGAVAVVAVLVSLGPIADGDIYWHLAAGRWMVEHRSLLRVDPFTVSAAGRPWIDVHWLFQLGVAVWHGWTGFLGLSVAKAAAVALAAVLLTHSAERAGGARGRLLCAVLLGAALIAARQLLPLRPIIVTVLFLAVTLDLLEGWRAGAWSTGRRRFWGPLGLAALQIVWVNCQGLAPLGPALIAAYLVGAALARAGRRRAAPAAAASATPPSTRELGPPSLRPLMAALGLVGLASLVTPYGLGAVTLPARLLARLSPRDANVFSTSVAENIPPFVLARTAPAEIAHFTEALLLAGLALVVWRPRLPAPHLIALGGFLGLASIATRNIPLFYLVAAPLLSIALANRAPGLAPAAGSPAPAAVLRSALRARFGRLQGAAALVLPRAGAVLLAGEIMLASVALAREAPIGAPTPFRFPVESVRRLAARGAAGPIFAPDHQGGFLTFTLPQLRPYLDTRLVLHTAQEYAEFLALLDDPPTFDAFADREGFRYVVLTTSNPDRYVALAAHLLDSSSAWSLLYTDGSELLFGRASEGPGLDLRDRAAVDRIRAELRERFPDAGPVARMATLNLARLLVVAGLPQDAERVLSGERSRAAAALRARARFVAGDLAAAETLARVLVGDGGGQDAPELALLGEIALARRHADESRDWARRALAADPYAPEARSLLSRLAKLASRTD